MKKLHNNIFVAALCALIVSLNLAGVAGWHRLNILICILVLGIVLVGAGWKLVHCVLFFALMSVSGIVLAWLQLPVFWLIFFLPLIVATLIILPFKATRQALRWLRIGTIDRLSWVLLAVTSLLSVAALLIWAYWTDNLGMGIQNMRAFSQYPLWLVAGVVVPVFALVNAALEEAVYRGILQEGLMHVLTNNALILVLQASAFAAAHFAVGFPNGAMGYLMVFTWGTMLGYLRIRTIGMIIPYLAHVLADLVIGYTLYAFSLAMW
jgi:hypothetical protein